MTQSELLRFIAQQITESVSAYEIERLCDRLAGVEADSGDLGKAMVAAELRELLEQ